jgi:hypothetical protein
MKYYNCKLCKRKFGSKHGLDIHISIMHKRKRPQPNLFVKPNRDKLAEFNGFVEFISQEFAKEKDKTKVSALIKSAIAIVVASVLIPTIYRQLFNDLNTTKSCNTRIHTRKR